MSKIRNIIFDMGGVILPMQPNSEPIRRFAQIGLDPKVGEALFSPYGQKGIFDLAESGHLSPEEFLVEYGKLTGFHATFDQVAWAWSGFVHSVPPERLEWLEQLRAEGYHTALLSNTNPFLVNDLTERESFSPQGLPMSAFFCRVYYSFDLGACKPNPKAFREMLRRGGYTPGECLFLDDALHNVEAARREGMQSIHVPDNQDWIVPLRQYLATQ